MVGEVLFDSDLPGFDDLDDEAALVQVLSFIVASYNMNAQACALAMELEDMNDDNLPNHLDGDFSVDARRPVYDYYESIVSGPPSIFYNQSGFTLEEWRVRIYLSILN
jgi:hypothetical protein